MSAKSLSLAGLAVIALATSVPAAESGTTAKGERPDDSPGWVVIDEDWFYPLRFESITALNNARYHYRRNEEKTAAHEIRKAVSWLKYAESHAMPMTRKKLTAAADEMTTLADDVEAGRVDDATRLDAALAHSSAALAEWHYYKARENYGRNEEHFAAMDLEAAAMHLQNAANSAYFEFGPDTMTTFEEVFRDGKLVSSHRDVDHNRLGTHLQAIEHAVNELSDTLNNS